MLRSAIPGKFPEIWGQNADPATITYPIPTTTGTPGRASLDKGFTAVNATPIASGGIPPWEQDFNGWNKWLSQWANWQQAGATVQYDAAFVSNFGGYPNGAILASTAVPGLQWQSTADNNTTDPDGGSPANWVPVTMPLSSARAGGGVSTTYVHAGNPNGNVAGSAGVAGTSPPDQCWDVTNAVLYACTTSGNAAAAVWTLVSILPKSFVAIGSTTGSANAQAVGTLDHAGYALTVGNAVLITPGFTNTGAATLNVLGTGNAPVRKVVNNALVALTGGELQRNQPIWVITDGVNQILVATTAVVPGAAVQKTNALVNYTPSTSSEVMAGIALAFTPMTTGNLLLGVVLSVSVEALDVQIRYGIGAPPSQGASASGTSVGLKVQGGGTSASSTILPSIFVVVPNLILGSTYWLDVAVTRVATGAEIFGFSASALEQ